MSATVFQYELYQKPWHFAQINSTLTEDGLPFGGVGVVEMA